MNGTKMKNLFGKGMLGILLGGIITLSVYPLSAQTNSRSGKGLYEIFSTKIPDGAQWKAQDNKFVRDGGYSKKTENYIYVGASKSPAELTGLSIPIRENPGPGEFRYITFAWVKWGGDQIGMKFHVSEKSANQKARNMILLI